MEYTLDEGALCVELPDRIDTNNAYQVEEEMLRLPLKDADEIIFDADKLDYISSIGLRVILKCGKVVNDTPISIINVNDKVYRVFEETGFTTIYTIYRKLRFVKTSDLLLLGQGMYGSVYRIDNEQILKVYHGIESEKEMKPVMDAIRTAFVHGISSIIPFEVVRTDRGIGTILELVDAEMLSTCMHEHPEQIDQYTDMMVELSKTIGSTVFEAGALRSRSEMLLAKLDNADEYLLPEEVETVRTYINAVPDRNTGVHGDFHARNLMVKDNSLMLIDMDEFSCGHPIWDIGNVMTIYYSIPHLDPEIGKVVFGLPDTSLFAQTYFKIAGVTFEEAERIWNGFFEGYFGEYTLEEKVSIRALAEFYASLKFVTYLIDSCNVSKGNVEKVNENVRVIRLFLEKLKDMNIEALKPALDVWK